MSRDMGVPPQAGSGCQPSASASAADASSRSGIPNADPLHLVGDCLYYPTPPTLGGGQKPTQWLRSIADMDEKRGASARAREAREIADWLTRMARWAQREFYDPAPLPAQAIEAGTGETTKIGSTAKRRRRRPKDAPNPSRPTEHPGAKQ